MLIIRISSLILLLFLSSCSVVCRFCDVTVRDSIRDVIEYRDTTIFVVLPADTVRDTIPIVNEYAYSRLETLLAVSTAKYDSGVLTHVLRNKTDPLPSLVKFPFRERIQIRYRTIKENYVSGWQWFQIYGFWVLAGILSIVLVLNKSSLLKIILKLFTKIKPLNVKKS